MDKDPFKEYMKQSEPNKRDKGYAWHTAIGLQAVDGLKPRCLHLDLPTAAFIETSTEFLHPLTGC